VIDQWGVEKTLRALSVVILVTIGPLLYFVKGRLPDSRVHGPSARSSGDRAWMKNPVVWTFTLINTLQSLAYFIPMVWIPSWLSDLIQLANVDSRLSICHFDGPQLF
jgi:MCP family monocarboxylic acid transporter-like MFS transporter 10